MLKVYLSIPDTEQRSEAYINMNPNAKKDRCISFIMPGFRFCVYEGLQLLMQQYIKISPDISCSCFLISFGFYWMESQEEMGVFVTELHYL